VKKFIAISTKKNSSGPAAASISASGNDSRINFSLTKISQTRPVADEVAVASRYPFASRARIWLSRALRPSAPYVGSATPAGVDRSYLRLGAAARVLRHTAHQR
jgi:hypothetical protein